MIDEMTAYRGLWCAGCRGKLDMEGYCPRCEPAATEEEIDEFVARQKAASVEAES